MSPLPSLSTVRSAEKVIPTFQSSHFLKSVASKVELIYAKHRKYLSLLHYLSENKESITKSDLNLEFTINQNVRNICYSINELKNSLDKTIIFIENAAKMGSKATEITHALNLYHRFNQSLKTVYTIDDTFAYWSDTDWNDSCPFFELVIYKSWVTGELKASVND